MQTTLGIFSYAIVALFSEEKFENIQKQTFIREAPFLYEAVGHKKGKNMIKINPWILRK